MGLEINQRLRRRPVLLCVNKPKGEEKWPGDEDAQAVKLHLVGATVLFYQEFQGPGALLKWAEEYNLSETRMYAMNFLAIW